MTKKLIRNENEAIEAIKSNMPTSGYYMLREALEMAISALEEIQQYRALGTVEELREVMEKQVPKKPIRVIIGSHDSTDGCGNCGNPFYEKVNFCMKCGQAIDWGDA